MKITLDTVFNTREELDSFVRTRVGDDSKENIKHEIDLTPEEAQKLSLSNDTTVFGVRVNIIE